MQFTFNIPPKPQSRPRFTRHGRPYELKDMKEYKQAIESMTKEQLKCNKLVDVPLKVSIKFYIEPPQYISKVKKNTTELEQETMRVFRKPDIDNYVKAILDAMNDVVFKDDGQIAVLQAEKVYSLNARTEVTIERLD